MHELDMQAESGGRVQLPESFLLQLVIRSVSACGLQCFL